MRVANDKYASKKKKQKKERAAIGWETGNGETLCDAGDSDEPDAADASEDPDPMGNVPTLITKAVRVSKQGS